MAEELSKSIDSLLGLVLTTKTIVSDKKTALLSILDPFKKDEIDLNQTSAKLLAGLMFKFWETKNELLIKTSFDISKKVILLTLQTDNQRGKILLLKTMRKSSIAFRRSAKINGPRNEKHMKLISAQIVDLCSINHSITFGFAFNCLQELAKNVKDQVYKVKPSKAKGKDETKTSFSSLVSWEFLHQITLWSNFISKNAFSDSTENEKNNSKILAPLLYPLISIATASLSVANSPNFAPFRIHLLETIIGFLDDSDGKVFVPLSSQLLALVQLCCKNKFAEVSEKKIDFGYVLVVKNSELKTSLHQLLEISTKLLKRFFFVYKYSLSFPEFVLIPALNLRKMVKESAHFVFNKKITSLLKDIDSQSNWVKEERKSFEDKLIDINSLTEDSGQYLKEKSNGNIALRSKKETLKKVSFKGILKKVKKPKTNGIKKKNKKLKQNKHKKIDTVSFEDEVSDDLAGI